MAFDYYLDMTFRDGTQVSFTYGDAKTDVLGNWVYSSGNLDLYTSTPGVSCYSTCVDWDSFGCTAYADDCYSTTYDSDLNVSDIRNTVASIGIPLIDGSYLYSYASQTLASAATSATHFAQSDIFSVNVRVIPGATAGENTVASKGESKNSVIRKTKVKKIKDLSTLTADQMALVIKSREKLGLPLEGPNASPKTNK